MNNKSQQQQSPQQLQKQSPSYHIQQQQQLITSSGGTETNLFDISYQKQSQQSSQQYNNSSFRQQNPKFNNQQMQNKTTNNNINNDKLTQFLTSSQQQINISNNTHNISQSTQRYFQHIRDESKDFNDSQFLIDSNRQRFIKIFQLVGQSNNGKITFSDLQKFCKQTNIFPDLTNLSDFKKIVSHAIYDNDKTPINNNHQLTYEQFEKILIEIANQTLHLAKNQTERIKIFLMHIRNPCKMHYQIQNFVFEITNKNNPNNLTSSIKTISKIQPTLESHQQSLNLDNKSEKSSLNFMINPQLSQKTYSQGINSVDISPIKNNLQDQQQQQQVNYYQSAQKNEIQGQGSQEDIYQLDSLIKNQKSMSRTQKVGNLDYSSSQLNLHHVASQEYNKLANNNNNNNNNINNIQSSFATHKNDQSSRSQRSLIDDNLELALKTLKSNQKANSQQSQNSSLNRQQSDQKSYSKKDQIMYNLKQQVQEQKSSKTSRDNTRQINKLEQDQQKESKQNLQNINSYPNKPKQQSLLTLSPINLQSTEHLIVVQDMSNSHDNNSQVNIQSPLSYNQQDSTFKDSVQMQELKEFLEYEKQLVNNNDNNTQQQNQGISSQESSMHNILSPQSKFSKFNDENQKSVRSKQQVQNGISQSETNFTFAENRGQQSTRNNNAKQFTLQDLSEVKQVYGSRVTKQQSTKQQINKKNAKSNYQSKLQVGKDAKMNNTTERENSKSKERPNTQQQKQSSTQLQQTVQKLGSPRTKLSDTLQNYNNKKNVNSNQKHTKQGIQNNKSNNNTTVAIDNKTNIPEITTQQTTSSLNNAQLNTFNNQNSQQKQQLDIKSRLNVIDNIKTASQTPQNIINKEILSYNITTLQDTQSVDLLQQALDREEFRKIQKQNKLDKYKSFEKQLLKMFKIVKKVNQRQGFQRVNKYINRQSKVSQGFNILTKNVKIKQMQYKYKAFIQILQYNENKRQKIYKGIFILSQTKLFQKCQQKNTLLNAFNKYKDYVNKKRQEEFKDMQQYIIKQQKQKSEFENQLQRLSSLHSYFNQRIKEM